MFMNIIVRRTKSPIKPPLCSKYNPRDSKDKYNYLNSKKDISYPSKYQPISIIFIPINILYFSEFCIMCNQLYNYRA